MEIDESTPSVPACQPAAHEASIPASARQNGPPTPLSTFAGRRLDGAARHNRRLLVRRAATAAGLHLANDSTQATVDRSNQRLRRPAVAGRQLGADRTLPGLCILRPARVRRIRPVYNTS